MGDSSGNTNMSTASVAAILCIWCWMRKAASTGLSKWGRKYGCRAHTRTSSNREDAGHGRRAAAPDDMTAIMGVVVDGCGSGWDGVEGGMWSAAGGGGGPPPPSSDTRNPEVDVDEVGIPVVNVDDSPEDDAARAGGGWLKDAMFCKTSATA